MFSFYVCRPSSQIIKVTRNNGVPKEGTRSQNEEMKIISICLLSFQCNTSSLYIPVNFQNDEGMNIV